MNERNDRTIKLIGEEAFEKLESAHVAVFGLGGVGSYVCEALARAGIGKLTLIDADKVVESNINRQLIATTENLGKFKTDACQERVSTINPDCIVIKKNLFYLPENADVIPLEEFDYIVDAVDTVSAKIELAVRAENASVSIISSMGTGNKLQAEMFEIADIYKTSVCPLCKVMRHELKKRGVKRLTVVYSKEEAKCNARPPASISFVPGAAGLIIAGKVIRDLIGIE